MTSLCRECDSFDRNSDIKILYRNPAWGIDFLKLCHHGQTCYNIIKTTVEVFIDIQAVLAHLDGLFADKKLDDVAPFLTSQLEAAREKGDAGAVLSLMNELVGFYRSTSQTAASLSMAQQALQMVEAMGLENTPAQGTTLINAATAYRAAGELEDAIALYAQALVVFEALGENGYALASLLNNMSQVYQALNRHADALPFLERALSLLMTLDGVDAEIATTHSNIAISDLALGARSQAKEHLDAALHIFEAGSGPRDAHYGAALSAAASLAYAEGDYARAVQLYEKALPEIRSSFGENDGYHITRQNLALAQQALKEAQS